MNDVDDDATADLPPSLKLLRGMVLALTGVMIVGFIVLVALFVTRFGTAPPPLPETVTLPDGEVARAVTLGSDWIAVVTDSDAILIFDRASGTLRQRVEIE